MPKILKRYSTYTLLVALVISAVAAYYSIVGLTAIFAAAVIPIIIMGAALEIGKVVAAVWLKLNWHRARWTYKLYLVPAVAFLMLLTSMGIFGFLSKAHTDQSLISGDSQAKLAIYDEKIKVAKDNIDANRKALKQMDEAVDQTMGRSSDEKGADKAVQIRRSQQRERLRLLADIEAEQKKISQYMEDRAPLAAENRKIEAEVGPIKFIAALIYGDNPDANLLEAAVRWVIILIVLVFDPLALVLILAAQQSMRWEREEEEQRERDEEQDVHDFFAQARATAREIDLQQELEKLAKIEQELAEANQQQLEEKQNIVNYEPDDGQLTAKQIEQVEASVPRSMVKRAKRAKIKTVLTEIEEPQSQPEPQPEVTVEISPQSEPEVEPQPEIQPEVKPEVKQEPEPIIDTKGTKEKVMFKSDAGYVWWEGKQTSIDALRGIRPDLILPTNGKLVNKFNFARQFPQEALTGDLIMRTDVRPHRLYKFNGVEWIHVDKNQNTSYLGNREYIQFLIDSLNSRKYLPEMLTEPEEEEIWRVLNQQPSTNISKLD